MCNWFQNKSPTLTFAVDCETWHCKWAAPCYFNGASPTGSLWWDYCLQWHLACEGLYSPVYNVICHCQGTYGAERLWEGSLKYNKTENCSGINRAFGKRESFRRVLLKYRYTTFNQSPMKWPSFPWKSSYRWQYPFPYCVVCQPIPCLK